ncbi:MAG TPA: CPBP family intramembrane metalloprotease, partial [Candidatus Faecivivens stercorigallinarum]|nr:CPBP family intramembrane metalloprotease [Candidatus Faecivivens stercorigallinarum]
ILAFEIIQLMICLFLLPPSQYQWNFSLPILQISPKGIVQIICVQLFYAVTQEILFRGYLQRQLNVFFHSENVRIIFVACFAALCQAVPLLFPESIAMFTDRLHNGTATLGSLAMMAVRDLGGTLLLGLAAGFLTARKKEYTTLSAICTHLIWGYLPAMLFSLNISL